MDALAPGLDLAQLRGVALLLPVHDRLLAPLLQLRQALLLVHALAPLLRLVVAGAVPRLRQQLLLLLRARRRHLLGLHVLLVLLLAPLQGRLLARAQLRVLRFLVRLELLDPHQHHHVPVMLALELRLGPLVLQALPLRGLLVLLLQALRALRGLLVQVLRLALGLELLLLRELVDGLLPVLQVPLLPIRVLLLAARNGVLAARLERREACGVLALTQAPALLLVPLLLLRLLDEVLARELPVLVLLDE